MGEKLAGSSRKKVRKKIMGTVFEKTAWRGMEETVSIGNEKPQQNNSLFFSTFSFYFSTFSLYFSTFFFSLFFPFANFHVF